MSNKDTGDGTVVSSPLETIIQGCHGCMTCSTDKKGDRPQSQRILSPGSHPAQGSLDLAYVRKDRRNGVPVFKPREIKHSHSVKPSPQVIIEEATSSSQASKKGGRRGSVTGSLPWSSTTTTNRKTVPNESEMHGVNQRGETKKVEREARMQRRAQIEEEDKNLFGLSGIIRKFLAGEPQGGGENRDVESESHAKSPPSEDEFGPMGKKQNTQLWSPRMEETRKATREKMMSEGNYWKCEFCHSDNSGDVDRCDICGHLRVKLGLHGMKKQVVNAPKKQSSVKEKSGTSAISPGSTTAKDLASKTSLASSRTPRHSSSKGTPGSGVSKTPQSSESMWGPDSIPGGSTSGSRRPSAE